MIFSVTPELAARKIPPNPPEIKKIGKISENFSQKVDKSPEKGLLYICKKKNSKENFTL